MARDPRLPPRDLLHRVSLIQGAYYITTGLWAVVSIRTFQLLTGPKVDLWLVKTIGLLLAAIGTVLGLAGLRRAPEPTAPLLGAGSAAVLAGVDLVYAGRRCISRVYLVDALAELALIAGWLLGWLGREPVASEG